jgi:uncharacterized protein YndB with AHSA1/START domain
VSGLRLDVVVPEDEPVIIFRRAFKAPAPLVFDAWTDPVHLRKWRGPRGFEMVSCEVDLRPGGGYRFTHRSPDGGLHVFHGRYREVERPDRLVSTFAYGSVPDTEGLDEVTFEEDDDGVTLVTGRSAFPTFQVREWYVAGNAKRGIAESQERLSDLLATLLSFK